MKIFEKKIYTFFLEKHLTYIKKDFLYSYKNKFMQSYIKNKKKSYTTLRYLKKKLLYVPVNINSMLAREKYRKQQQLVRRRPFVFQKHILKLLKKNKFSMSMNPLKKFYKRSYFISQGSSIIEELISKLTLHGTRAAAKKIFNYIFAATKWQCGYFFTKSPLTKKKIAAYWKKKGKKKRKKRKYRQRFSPTTRNALLTLFEYWTRFGAPMRYRLQRYSAATPLKLEYVPTYKTFLPQFAVLRKYLLKINFTNNKNYYFFHYPADCYARMLLRQIFRQNGSIFTGYLRHLKTILNKYAYIVSIKATPAV